jgi:hypothetical protein
MSEGLDHIDEQEQDRFEARFFGNLSPLEAQAFDSELARDGGLAERYAAFQLAIAGIRSLQEARKVDTAALRARLAGIDHELDQGGPRRIPWWSLATAAAVVLAFGVWWWSRPLTDAQLADRYAIPEPGLPVLMSTAPTDLDAIMNAYKMEDLATAGHLLQKALIDSPTNDTLLYFQAVVTNAQGDHDAALEQFKAVTSPSAFADKAQYQIALGRLREGGREEAKMLLSGLRHSSDAMVADRAERLLERL